jgi:hypothetical protein
MAGKRVRLPQDALISDEKLVKYLLAPRRRNDKSRWLAQAGYTLENWPILKDDIRKEVLPKDDLDDRNGHRHNEVHNDVSGQEVERR